MMISKKKLNDMKNKIMMMMPVSMKTMILQRKEFFILLEAQKELQMLNRQDIMALAATYDNKPEKTNEQQKNVKINDSMFG